MDNISQPLGKLGLVATITGVIALLAWGQYEIGWLLTTALLAGGLGLVAGAVEIVLAQRGHPLQGVGRLQNAWGLALYPRSLILLIVGLGLLVLGGLHLLGMTDTFLMYIARHPGPALFLAGLVIFSAGVETAINPTYKHKIQLLDFLGKFPARLFGVLLVLLGLCALLLGLLEILAPLWFDRWLADLLGPFAP